MEKLSFYDVKTKGKFETDQYEVKEKSGRFFAVAKSSERVDSRMTSPSHLNFIQ